MIHNYSTTSASQQDCTSEKVCLKSMTILTMPFSRMVDWTPQVPYRSRPYTILPYPSMISQARNSPAQQLEATLSIGTRHHGKAPSSFPAHRRRPISWVRSYSELQNIAAWGDCSRGGCRLWICHPRRLLLTCLAYVELRWLEFCVHMGIISLCLSSLETVIYATDSTQTMIVPDDTLSRFSR